MSWTCENSCHIHAEDDFGVTRGELREDLIVHTFGKGDKDLENSTSFQVYEGSNSSYYSPACALCEGSVVWEEEQPQEDDRLDACRSEPLRKALRQLGQTPKHLQDMDKATVVDWVRENCCPAEVAELAIKIGGTIDPRVLERLRRARGED